MYVISKNTYFNMSEPKIHFSLSDDSFIPAKREEEWVDSSFSQVENPVGILRLPAVNNGRYESKHPVLNISGETIGFLQHGSTFLGYTWECIYGGGCFWIVNQTFTETLNGGKVCNVSIVENVGKFLFSSFIKFKVVKSFEFDGS